jgi:hypothetical protein
MGKWENLAEYQKTGSFEAIQEIEAINGIRNQVVKGKLLSKYIFFDNQHIASFPM